MKKYLLLLIGIIGLGLINFSSASSCANSTILSVTSDSYIYFSYADFPGLASGEFASLLLEADIDGVSYSYNYTCSSSMCYVYDNILNDFYNSPLILKSGSWNLTSSGFNECIYGLIPVSLDSDNIDWSSLYVNNNQITGANSVYIYTPDFLKFTPEYFDSYVDLNFENVGDPEYIENVLSIQSYHPDKDQFAQSFSGFLTLLMPYIIITLFIVFVWRLIRRIFK